MNFKRHTYILLLVSCFCLPANAQTDGTQYPITDPRNPNCPCHEHQKKADEEYRRMLQNNNNNIIVQQQNTNEQNPISQNNNAQQPLPNFIAQQNNENEFPQINTPQLSKPEINFSFNAIKKTSATYSGVNIKYKKHSWKKFSFKMNRKFQKTFHAKKKIKTKPAACFKW